jgi:hypothetical protein
VPRLSEQQIEDARSVSLLAYMQQHEPSCLKHQSATGRHVHKDHDSFVIDNGKGEWYWNSRSVGGHSSLDYLQRIEGMDFVSAVKFLTEGNGKFYEQDNSNSNPGQTSRNTLNPSQPSQGKPDTIQQTANPAQTKPQQERPPPKPKRLTLPKANVNNAMAVNYLMSRGISKPTIWRCINAGLLYESVNKSCVFVGKDGDIPKYACERSISGDGKKDVLGADKKYGFSLPPVNHDNPGSHSSRDSQNASDSLSDKTLIAFESPIDLLAHMDIMKMADKDWDGHRLSLGGVSSSAINSFLERNPQISHVYLCLDADKAGQDAARRIAHELLGNSKTAGIKITIAPPPLGKDFADTLQGILKLQRDKQMDREPKTQQKQTKQEEI